MEVRMPDVDPFGITQDQNASRIHALIQCLTYKKGWSFALHAYQGHSRALQISVETVNSKDGQSEYETYNSYSYIKWDRFDRPTNVQHFTVVHRLPIPPYPIDDVERWVLDQILKVETHEACEFFKVNGFQTYFPEHGANSDPYKVERRS
jgi:hypothetical protein